MFSLAYFFFMFYCPQLPSKITIYKLKCLILEKGIKFFVEWKTGTLLTEMVLDF